MIRGGHRQGGLLALLFTVGMTGATAQEPRLFAVPEGCSAYLTVMQRGCRVEHHYTCEATGTDRWRVVLTETGPVYLSRIDAEAQWVSSWPLPVGDETRTLFPAKDPASMTTLLETGFDDFDFEQQRPDGRIERVTGSDRVVARDVVIDGEPLYQTEFSVTYRNEGGELLGTYEGREYASPRHRRFFAGRGRSAFGDVVTEFDRTPQEFIYPGEPGFLSVTPRYDCGMMMSALEVLP